MRSAKPPLSNLSSFTGRDSLDGEGVDELHFLAEGGVHGLVPLQAAHPFERRALDAQREVALPAETTRPRMARMLTRFVLQLQEARVEGGTQALLDARADRAQA